MAFHIAILYDIYLPGLQEAAAKRRGWESGLGSLEYTEVTGMMCGLRMRPLADADLQNF